MGLGEGEGSRKGCKGDGKMKGDLVVVEEWPKGPSVEVVLWLG